MEQRDLQRLLLKTAVCTIACDGEIHDKEIAELNTMVTQAVYFKDFNGKEALVEMLGAVKNDGKKFLHLFLEDLKSTELSIVQELLILEVILRIVYADERFDADEEMFLRLVRTQFSLHDEIIIQRFGTVPCITQGKYVRFSTTEVQNTLDKIVGKFDNIQANEKVSVPNFSTTSEIDFKAG